MSVVTTPRFRRTSRVSSRRSTRPRRRPGGSRPRRPGRAGRAGARRAPAARCGCRRPARRARSAGFAPRRAPQASRSRGRLAVPLTALALALRASRGSRCSAAAATVTAASSRRLRGRPGPRRATSSRSSVRRATRARRGPHAAPRRRRRVCRGPGRAVGRRSGAERRAGGGAAPGRAPGGLDDVASGIVPTTDALGGYVVSSSVESRGPGGSAAFDLRVRGATADGARPAVRPCARALAHAELARRHRKRGRRANPAGRAEGGAPRRPAPARVGGDAGRHARRRGSASACSTCASRAPRPRVRPCAAAPPTAPSTSRSTTQRPSAGASSRGGDSWTPGDAWPMPCGCCRSHWRRTRRVRGAAACSGSRRTAGFGAWRIDRHAPTPASRSRPRQLEPRRAGLPNLGSVVRDEDADLSRPFGRAALALRNTADR